MKLFEAIHLAKSGRVRGICRTGVTYQYMYDKDSSCFIRYYCFESDGHKISDMMRYVDSCYRTSNDWEVIKHENA